MLRRTHPKVLVFHIGKRPKGAAVRFAQRARRLLSMTCIAQGSKKAVFTVLYPRTSVAASIVFLTSVRKMSTMAIVIWRSIITFTKVITYTVITYTDIFRVIRLTTKLNITPRIATAIAVTIITDSRTD
ncbi:unnamed protein product [Amoebophrya sp. A25]|nr:unnamed protein product [Amoebophrya sp. A25]|eukprot:GSA25T00021739001.1